MKKKIFIFTLLFASLSLIPLTNKNSFIDVKGEEDIFITSLNEDGQVELIGVNDTSKDEYRIYETNHIDIITANAFKSCSYISSIMISSLISIIESGALEINSLTTIIFTGSESKWSNYQYSTDKNVIYYGYDEGFISYWNENVRQNKDTSLCDIKYENYLYIKNLYSSLNEVDKAVVDAYQDKSDISIKDSISFLNSYFNPDTTPSNQSDELKQGTTLRLVIYIAIFGLTSICIFFLLKTKKIID